MDEAELVAMGRDLERTVCPGTLTSQLFPASQVYPLDPKVIQPKSKLKSKDRI